MFQDILEEYRVICSSPKTKAVYEICRVPSGHPLWHITAKTGKLHQDLEGQKFSSVPKAKEFMTKFFDNLKETQGAKTEFLKAERAKKRDASEAN